jgi:hypothetical protein
VLLTFNGWDGVLTKTVLSVFPYAQVYRYFCIASESPIAIDESRKDALLSELSSSQRAVIRERGDWYLGDREALLAKLAGYPTNTDWKPAAEYFLGVGFKGGKRMEWRPGQATSDTRPDSLPVGVEHGSRRLQVETVHLLQIHWADAHGAP